MGGGCGWWVVLRRHHGAEWVVLEVQEPNARTPFAMAWEWSPIAQPSLARLPTTTASRHPA